MYLQKSITVLFILFFIAGLALGQSVIRCVPTRNYPTIQSAINACNDYDHVKVDPGTYTENLDYHGKAITVRSDSGDPTDTIIDGGMNGSVVSFVTEEGNDTVLKGFGITNGSGTAYDGSPNYQLGGGIYCYYAGPKIENCHIYDNDLTTSSGGEKGGGIYIGVLGAGPTFRGRDYEFEPIIKDCKIYDNLADTVGSGIYIELFEGGMPANPILGDELSITGCEIYGNDSSQWGSAIAIMCAYNDSSTCKTTIKNNVIYDNGCWYNTTTTPSAVTWDSGDQIIFVNNIVYGHEGAGIEINIPGSSSSAVTHNTFFDNHWYAISVRVSWGYSFPWKIYNNICWENGDKWGGYTTEIFFSEWADGVVINCYNNCIENGEDAIDIDGTGVTLNYYDNITTDPDFVNEATGDLHIKSTSDCVDEGHIDAPEAPAKDFEGDNRDEDPDIGADECTTKRDLF
jgi:hypothetical protein